MTRPILALVIVVLAVLAVGGAAAQTSLERAVQLYGAAEYEQALSAIGDGADELARQYRALCLLALGREQEAIEALQALVASFPEFSPSLSELPPRFTRLLTQVRQRVVPEVIRKLFAEGRAEYQENTKTRGLPKFERVLELSRREDVRALEGMSDVRLLAEGFVDLVKKQQAAAAPQGSPAAPVRPVASTPPSPRRQNLPPWPRNVPRLGQTTSGAVRVTIDPLGKVTAASITRSVAPHYDRAVLMAARDWEYVPATVNGTPVAAETIVEYRITVD